MQGGSITEQEIKIMAGEASLSADLALPPGAAGIVVFAHGSGSSRHSPRNKYVARVIQAQNLGTLLLDLLTPEEESVDIHTRHLRFDITLLAKRLAATARWLRKQPETKDLIIGFFGASTGAAAALVAAAELGDDINAVVSRGGRPDLAGDALTKVQAPVLLIVGGRDEQVIDWNKMAYDQLGCRKELKLVPVATHLFEEPGTLEAVAELAADCLKSI